MHLGDHHELSHHRFRLKFTELNEIYIFNSLRSLAFSFVTIFIPIYLLSLGYTIQAILSYYIIFYLFEAFTEFISVHLIRFLGPKHVITLSVPFVITHFFLLQTLSRYNWPLYFVALTGAIALGLYWQAYHYDFSKSKRRSTATKDVSRSYFLLYFTMMIAPLVGGILSDSFGIYITFTVVIALLLLGTLVLFKTGERHCRKRAVNFKLINFREIRGDIISRFGLGWEVSASMVIWPLFIYLILESYQSVGLVTSVSMILAMAAVYLVGKKVDRSKETKIEIIKMSSITKSMVYIFKIFVTSIFAVYAVNIFRAITGAILNVNLDSEYYLRADEKSRSEYIFVIETVIDISRAIFFLILLVASYYFSVRGIAVLGFLLGSIGAIMASFMTVTMNNKMVNNKKIKVLPRPQKRSSNA